MKRVLRFAAVNILGIALLAAGMPLQAATRNGNDRWQGNGDARYQSTWSQSQRNNGRGSDQRDNGYRTNDRDDRGNRDYDRGDWRDRDRDRGAVYVPPAPNYYVNGYAYPTRGYYSDEDAGRTAAIVGGSVAAGAVIGAAAGHGQGAAVGAIIGGVAGAIASQAINHRDYR